MWDFHELSFLSCDIPSTDFLENVNTCSPIETTIIELPTQISESIQSSMLFGVLMLLNLLLAVSMWKMEQLDEEAWRGPVRPVDCCYKTLPSAEIPFCTDQTVTTTCPPNPCHGTPPYRVMCKYYLKRKYHLQFSYSF